MCAISLVWNVWKQARSDCNSHFETFHLKNWPFPNEIFRNNPISYLKFITGSEFIFDIINEFTLLYSSLVKPINHNIKKVFQNVKFWKIHLINRIFQKKDYSCPCVNSLSGNSFVACGGLRIRQPATIQCCQVNLLASTPYHALHNISF